MRGRMYDRESYVPPFQIGEVLQGGAVGRVTASAHPDFAEGDLVLSMAGWREAWTATPEAVLAQKLPGDTGLPDSAFLGIAGMPGLTAYAGILRVAELKGRRHCLCVWRRRCSRLDCGSKSPKSRAVPLLGPQAVLKNALWLSHSALMPASIIAKRALMTRS